MSAGTLAHTNAAYLPERDDLTLLDSGYWEEAWPFTLRGLAIHANKTPTLVARDLTNLAAEQPAWDADEVVTHYAASLGH